MKMEGRRRLELRYTKAYNIQCNYLLIHISLIYSQRSLDSVPIKPPPHTASASIIILIKPHILDLHTLPGKQRRNLFQTTKDFVGAISSKTVSDAEGVENESQVLGYGACAVPLRECAGVFSSIIGVGDFSDEHGRGLHYEDAPESGDETGHDEMDVWKGSPVPALDLKPRTALYPGTSWAG
jgi:hypothetical protein